VLFAASLRLRNCRMMSSKMPSGPTSLPPSHERLESWKEIAAYLKKGVRTVQRWERAEGLPVRRLGQDRTGLVFAYKSELDAWWLKQSGGTVTEPKPDAWAQPAKARTNWYLPPIVFIMTAAIVWAIIAWKPWRAAPIVYRPIPLTSEHGTAYQPSFSPDGRQIAFVWTPPGGRPSIHVKTIGFESSIRLTAGAQAEGSPAWSPDGRFIAFLRFLSPKRASALILIPAAGGLENQIAELTAAGGLSWSADAQWLITTDGPPKEKSIVAVSVTTGAKHVLTKPSDFGYLGAELSPDSRRLIFGQSSPGPKPIYELAIGSGLTPRGEPRPLMGNLWARDLFVTSDAKEVIFTDGSWDEGIDLWRLRLSRGAQPERITSTAHRCFTPALSRDGRRLAFAVNRIYREEIWKKSLSDPEAAPAPLLSSTHSELNPQYSPDGRFIAFHSTRSGASDIWIAGSDGTNPRRLTFSNARTTATPRWSPDGQWIAFESNQSGQSEVYVIPSAGGAVRRLTDNPAVDAIPSWSRDGRTLYFCSNRTGRYEIWKMPASGGQPTQVTFGGGFAAVESPDAKYLYYSQTRNYGPVLRMALAGGRAEPIIPEIRGLFYAVTSEGIYFQSTHTISFRDSASGRIHEVFAPSKPMSIGLAVSPDGQSLLFTQVEADGADLYMIDGLR
jgi:Tol biopolymer transport system component